MLVQPFPCKLSAILAVYAVANCPHPAQLMQLQEASGHELDAVPAYAAAMYPAPNADAVVEQVINQSMLYLMLMTKQTDGRPDFTSVLCKAAHLTRPGSEVVWLQHTIH